MYNKNINGPSTDPCVTPCPFFFVEEGLYLFTLIFLALLWFT